MLNLSFLPLLEFSPTTRATAIRSNNINENYDNLTLAVAYVAGENTPQRQISSIILKK